MVLIPRLVRRVRTAQAKNCMTKEQEVKNLESLKARKSQRLKLMLWKARKEGQIKTLRYLLSFFLRRQNKINFDEIPQHLSNEIFDEMKELNLITEDLRELKIEIGHLQRSS